MTSHDVAGFHKNQLNYGACCNKTRQSEHLTWKKKIFQMSLTFRHLRLVRYLRPTSYLPKSTLRHFSSDVLTEAEQMEKNFAFMTVYKSHENLKKDIAELKLGFDTMNVKMGVMKDDISKLRIDMKELRTELRTDMKELRTDMKDIFRNEMNVVGMMIKFLLSATIFAGAGYLVNEEFKKLSHLLKQTQGN